MNAQIASTKTQTHNLDIFGTHQKPATVSPSSVASEIVAEPITKEEINALHLEFQACGKNAREWMQKCKMLLPEIKEKEVWKRKGFPSIYEYARVLAGMSTFAVDDALWVMKKLEGKPSLKKVANEKGLNAVRPVLTVATEDDEKEWAKMAAELSHHALRTYVEEVKRNSPVCHDFDPEESCDVTSQNSENRMSKSIYMKLDVETIERMKKLKGDMDWDDLLNEMLNVYEESVETGNYSEGATAEESEKKSGAGNTARCCDTHEKPAPVNTGKRYVPKEIQKYVTKKTSGLCAYPGCSKPYEILHHTKRFALDSTHDPDTLKPLCKPHERLAHKGLIENEVAVPVEFMSGASAEDGKEAGGSTADKAEIKINWSLKAKPDISSPKYAIDEKVNKYYMPKLK